ncbi:lysophospholipid acyltransferase family protein [Virgibacillus sp. Bac332]|uniref:lysophospholipid acyltransferase family protein n=1 Tax=Virgibacillus sp. Bac332 TaxID=2419842 RepID=UPI0013CF01FB|nr:lysophospholipid acyltransferase family protein [Virgibacillus sp. Bac332]
MADGIMDFDIVESNPTIYQILRDYPFEFLYDFLKKGMSYEKNTKMAERWRKYNKEMVEIMRVLKRDSTDCEIEEFSNRWTDYLFYRNLDINLISMYATQQDFLEKHVRFKGLHNLDHSLKKGNPPVLVSLHMNAYQAIVPLLAAKGYRLSYFMDKQTLNVWNRIGESFLGEVMNKLSPIGLPQNSAIKQALRNLKEGKPLLMFPDFTLGDMPNVETKFLGYDVFVPIGPAKIATLLESPIIPIILEKSNRYQYTLRIEEPLFEPTDVKNVEEISISIFKWIEKEVKQCPENWWCWYIFRDKILKTKQEV